MFSSSLRYGTITLSSTPMDSPSYTMSPDVMCSALSCTGTILRSANSRSNARVPSSDSFRISRCSPLRGSA